MPKVLEFNLPEAASTDPPYVKLAYGDKIFPKISLETAEKYCGYVTENLLPWATEESPDVDVLMVPVLPLDPDAVKAVVDYLATGKATVAVAIRFDVLRAARWLAVDPLKQAVEENVNRACKLRTRLMLESLQVAQEAAPGDPFRTLRFKEARKHFSLLCSDPCWCRLKPYVVRELLNSDDVRSKETVIFDSVLKWLVNNPREIPSEIDRLLSRVRFGSMSTEDKFHCLIEARRVGLNVLVKPYLIQGDWYRSCLELNHCEFANMVEFDRVSHFIGENRRGRAIKIYETSQEKSRRRARSAAPAVVTVCTKPSACKRVQQSNIHGGTWLPRPRPQNTTRAQSVPPSRKAVQIQNNMPKTGYMQETVDSAESKQ